MVETRSSTSLLPPIETQPTTWVSQAGSLYFDREGRLINKAGADIAQATFHDPTLPDSALLERVDYRVVTLENSDHQAKLLVIGNVHPNEDQAVEAMDEDLTHRFWPRLEILRANLLGGALRWRGHVRPEQENESTTNSDPNYHRLKFKNGRLTDETDPAGVWGIEINLNRFFPVPDEAKNWAEVMAGLEHDEVELILEAIRLQPKLKVAVLVHEDLEFGLDSPAQLAAGRHGAYVYDTVFDGRTDLDKELVLQLMQNWRQAIQAAGMTTFTGIDDPQDPFLGNKIEQGYFYSQSLLNHEASLEAALVKLGHLGLTQIERAFVLEVPGHYSAEQKQLVVKLFNDLVIGPYLAAKGIC